MEWNKQKIKGLLLVVCGGVAFYCALQRLDAVLAALGWLLGILAPFLLGGALAFILNVPMRAIERHLFPRNRKGAKLRRPLALVLTLVAVIGVLALAGLVIGPGIADAVMSIIREIPAAFQRLEHQLTALAGEPAGPVASTGGAADEAAGGDPMAGAFCQGSGDRQGNWGRDCLLRWVHRRCGQRCQHLCHQPDFLLLCPAAEGEAGPPGPPGDLRPAAPAAGRPDAGRPAAVRADLLQLPLRASAWRPAFWARCSSRP